MSKPVNKPEFPEGYKRWLKDKIDVRLANPLERHYDTISRDVASAIEEWEVWCKIKNNLKEFDDQYKIKNWQL